MTTLRRNWIAIASAEHVRIGRREGFMQVCHGKVAPLRRIRPDDRVAYYSPSEAFAKRDGFSSLTAIGRVRTGEPYQVEMYPGFKPYRRDVDWSPCREIAIRPMLPGLAFGAKPNWGYQLRFGLLEICAADMDVIAAAMQAEAKTAA